MIGNPPYKEKAKGRGGWIENGTAECCAPLDRWGRRRNGVWARTQAPAEPLCLFLALGDVEGLRFGWLPPGEPDKVDDGIVCFITVAGFLNGPGFQKMRDDFRRTCSEIWVIDCSPEGHQPEVRHASSRACNSRFASCLAARRLRKIGNVPAECSYVPAARGRTDEKFESLAKLSLARLRLGQIAQRWREPFLPAETGAWAVYPLLEDFFV